VWSRLLKEYMHGYIIYKLSAYSDQLCWLMDTFLVYIPSVADGAMGKALD